MPFRSAATYHKNCKQLSLFWSRPTSVRAGRSNPFVKETWTGSERLEEFSTRIKSALHLQNPRKGSFNTTCRNICQKTICLKSASLHTERTTVQRQLYLALLMVFSEMPMTDWSQCWLCLTSVQHLTRWTIPYCYRGLRLHLAFLALYFTGLRPI